MIGYIRNKPLPARRYLALLVLPWCVMLLLAVAVLWPYLARFRTTVEALQDVQLPGVLEAQRTRTNLNMLRKQLAIIYLAEAPLERRRARLHAQALLAGMQESQKTLAQALADKPLRLTRRQWIPLAPFLIIALHSFTSPYWPEMPVLSALKEMDTVLFTSVALAVLALIRVDGEQIFCPVEAFTKGVSWPIVMAVASMEAIGGLLVADEYGIKAWLTQALGGLFSNHSPLLFVAMTVLITLLLTNFFSNTATLLVVSSLVSALSGPLVDAGYDITILAVAISLSSMVAYLTYASSGQAAILLSQKNMDNKFIWTYGIAAMLLYAAVVILVSAVCLFF